MKFIFGLLPFLVASPLFAVTALYDGNFTSNGGTHTQGWIGGNVINALAIDTQSVQLTAEIPFVSGVNCWTPTVTYDIEILSVENPGEEVAISYVWNSSLMGVQLRSATGYAPGEVDVRVTSSLNIAGADAYAILGGDVQANSTSNGTTTITPLIATYISQGLPGLTQTYDFTWTDNDSTAGYDWSAIRFRSPELTLEKVPEPSRALLLALGGVVLLAGRRK